MRHWQINIKYHRLNTTTSAVHISVTNTKAPQNIEIRNIADWRHMFVELVQFLKGMEQRESIQPSICPDFASIPLQHIVNQGNRFSIISERIDSCSSPFSVRHSRPM